MDVKEEDMNIKDLRNHKSVFMAIRLAWDNYIYNYKDTRRLEKVSNQHLISVDAALMKQARVGVCDAEKSNCEWWNCRTWLTCHKKILCVIIVIISIFSVISLGVAWHISNTKCSCKVKEEAPPPTAERFSALDMDNRDKDEMRTRVNHNNTINKNLDLAEIRFGEKHKNTINATCFLCDKECYGIDELKSSRGEMRCPRYIVTIACKHVSWMASRGNYCKGGESVCLGQDVSAHMCAYRQGNRPQVYNETLTTHT